MSFKLLSELLQKLLKRTLAGQLSWREWLFWVLFLTSLTPWVSAPIALAMGIVLAQVSGHPYQKYNKAATKDLLKYSVIGLGFGMNAYSAVNAGKDGMLFTIATISGTLILGAILAIVLKVDKGTSKLISSGTAICGGSAIAAVAPVIKADEKQISVALGIVFILNSLALFIFPPLGKMLNMSQYQFGLWSAIAIHDTSSVVGAASKYGNEALGIATTVKLGRALWIIPVTLLMALLQGGGVKNITIPYFIGWFIVAMLVNTFVPGIEVISPYIVKFAKAGLVLTLFLIGAGLSRETLKSVGIRPMLLGVILWIVISTVSLYVITNTIG